MFREMRRKKQELAPEDSIEILSNGTSGVLAVIGDDDYPYAVPLSYVCYDEKIVFHCAKEGHKLDAVSKNEKVSFCVIDQDNVAPGEFTTYYRSVIVFGKARILGCETEKRRALERLAEKYSPDYKKESLQYIDKDIDQVCMVEIAIEHMTGKEAMELVNKK